LACYLGLVRFDPDTLRFEGIVRRHLEIMTGAGIVAGLVYWMIAGRNAGAWREPPRRPTPPPPLPSNSRPPAPRTGLDFSLRFRSRSLRDCCLGSIPSSTSSGQRSSITR